MFFKNPDSKRENPFRKLYDNKEFKTIHQRKDKLPDFPFLVDVELTNHCNLKCIFCGQQAMKRDKGFMSETTLKKIVDECAGHNTPIRFIRLGEPFLHPKITDFCKYVKSKGLILHITSNGLAITGNHMNYLIELGVDSLIFSLQGATKEQYEAMRGDNTYDRLRGNVLKMVELRKDRENPFIHISSTMTDESKKEIDNFVNYWGYLIDAVSIGKTNLSLLSAAQINSFKAIGKLELLKKQETIKKEYRLCTEVYQKLSIDWDGKVTCCCGDFDNFLTVGDLGRSTLFDIWNSSKELRIFRELLEKNMHKCLTLCSTCYHAYDEF
ncbi:MAG: radical SAM protein [Candidatus Omnitrophota bacterium]|nr:MAG: radical SAM protein [Candidatus Omnitrophota bacterium]